MGRQHKIPARQRRRFRASRENIQKKKAAQQFQQIPRENKRAEAGRKRAEAMRLVCRDARQTISKRLLPVMAAVHQAAKAGEESARQVMSIFGQTAGE